MKKNHATSLWSTVVLVDLSVSQPFNFVLVGQNSSNSQREIVGEGQQYMKEQKAAKE